jgi:gluconate:H+ symporter, GntP family
MYIFLAIGFGSFGCSWMIDSGFWVVSRLGGLTMKETLRSWSVTATLMSFAGLMMTFVLSRIFPFV